MRYMLLIYGEPGMGPEPGTTAFDTEMSNWFAYTKDLDTSGHLISGEPLYPVETATTVRVRDGDRLTTDGPFAETREVLGGYYLIDVPGLDEALAWAAKMPNIRYGSVEVRAIMEFSPDA